MGVTTGAGGGAIVGAGAIFDGGATFAGGGVFSAVAGGAVGATARAAWINSANTSVNGAPVSGGVGATAGGGGGSGSGFDLRKGDDRSIPRSVDFFGGDGS